MGTVVEAPIWGLAIVHEYAGAHGENAVSLFGLDVVPEWTIHRRAIGSIEPQLDGLVQSGLVVLHTQHIVGAAGDNLGSDVVLASHRVDRDDGAFDVERRQQFRYRRDLVTLVGCPDPP